MRILFEKTLLSVMASVLSALCLLVAYQVFARHLPFVPPLLWTEEVSRGLLIWLVMLGAGYGFLRQEHFLMSAFVDGLSPATKRKVQIVVQLIVLVCGILTLVSGVQFTQRGWGRISFASGLPIVWTYSALIVGGGLIALGAIINLGEMILPGRNKNYVLNGSAGK